MGIVIDIIIILIMLICIIIGYKKGLIKVAISFIAIILSILIAVIIYKPIAKQIINNTQIDENLKNTIYEKIKDVDFENMTEEDKKENQILTFAQSYIDEALEKSKENAAIYVAESLSETIIELGTFVALLIILRIALIILNLLSDIIGSLPIIKQFNKSGGVIYGLLEGFFIVSVLLAVAYIINPICLEGKIEKSINKSELGKALYENNIIINTIIK
ncbi:MAG: CvpA family protein [Clostridia bacterium]